MICLDTCRTAGDSICQDGGWAAQGNWCEFGADCADCGSRLLSDQPPPSPTASQCSCSEDAVQAAKEAVQAAKDAEQARQAAATLMEEYERRKLSAAALESASSGLGLGQTIGVAVGCSLAVVLLVAQTLGLFVLKHGRRKGPSATNEAASGVQLKGGQAHLSEPSDLVAVGASRH